MKSKIRASFRSSVLLTLLLAPCVLAAEVSPLVGTWTLTQTTSKVPVTATVTFRTDRTFEHLLALPNARVIRTGTWTESSGRVSFPQQTCKVEGTPGKADFCGKPLYDSVWSIRGDELTVTPQVPSKSVPPLVLKRVRP